jgi:excisionase family DNA binding protein
MQESNTDLRVYNDRQVSEFLGISKRTVAELRATGQLAFVRLGRKRVGVRHCDLSEYLNRQRNESADAR